MTSSRPLIESFLKCDASLVPVWSVASIDTERLEELVVVVKTIDGELHQATGINAVELVMQTRPGAFEGKRFKWAKRVWMFHNLVGHPLMQLAALAGLYGLAMKIHDGTVPKPIGKKK